MEARIQPEPWWTQQRSCTPPSEPGATPRASSRCSGTSCCARPDMLLAIVGLSGASKSTLLEILAARLSPSPPLTVREMLLFSTCLCLGTRLPFKDIGARVEALLDNLTLRRVAATGIKDLSGGERRRISIGVEAVHDRPVLIASSSSSAPPASTAPSRSGSSACSMVRCSCRVAGHPGSCRASGPAVRPCTPRCGRTREEEGSLPSTRKKRNRGEEEWGRGKNSFSQRFSLLANQK